MNFRMGLFLAAALTLAGCAGGAGTGTSTAAPMARPAAGGAELAQGERPRENTETRGAARAIRDAGEAATPEEAEAKYLEAIQLANAAVEADPTNPLAHRLLGEAYMGFGDYPAAAASLDEAVRLRPIYEIELDPVRERAWVELYQEAATFVSAGDYAGSAPVFENANAIYAKRPEVKAYLGQIYVQLGEYDRGLELMREARAIINSERIAEMDEETAASWRETDSQLVVYIAQALMGAQRYGEAAQELQLLLEADPGNMDYQRQLASLYVELGRPEDAAGMFKSMYETPGLEGSDYYAIGIGFYQLEDWAMAAEAFGRAHELSVNDRDALEMEARSLQIAYPQGEDAPTPPEGTLERIAMLATRWSELDPANRNALLVLAQTQQRLGDTERAGQLVGQIEQLPVFINNLQLQRYAEGGAMVFGQMMNQSRDVGATIVLRFTFYDAAGAEIGTQDVQVTVPEAEASQSFQAEFSSTQTVGGYSYRIMN